MDDARRRTWMMAVVGGLSALVLLLGIATTVYSLPVAIGAALAIRLIGAGLVNWLTR